MAFSNAHPVGNGTVLTWRITRSKSGSKTEAFSGKGAALYPGRWNHPGVPIVYTSSSIALTVLEVLVHAHDRRVLNGRFTVFQCRIPAELIAAPALSIGLRELHQTRDFGSHWIQEGTHAVLRVPSIITGEPNYLLDPNHSDFAKIEIGPPDVFQFDERLIR